MTHQTKVSVLLYIFWFLHQTTTIECTTFLPLCCISFDSYIKPQLLSVRLFFRCVVYLLIPTSNHNQLANLIADTKLYIFWFLHQTTTWGLQVSWRGRCISFDSYIKPQQKTENNKWSHVVYLLIPTSNHNSRLLCNCETEVVYLLIPTSNHNIITTILRCQKLYIFWFLHQTTTYNF